MPNEKFQNKYRIASARAMWHDYSGGAYFITVCTKTREHSFGEIIVETGRAPSKSNDIENNKIERDEIEIETGRAPSLQVATMQLSGIGQFLFDNLQNVTDRYPYAEIPLFVVMPNHWHAIVFIDGEKTPYIRGHAAVETGRAPSISTPSISAPSISAMSISDISVHAKQINQTGRAPSLQSQQMQKIDSYKGWLSVAIGGIKSAVTKYANENKIVFEWQTRFHDHIIRDQAEMNHIADYIENNLTTWDNDCFNFFKNNK